MPNGGRSSIKQQTSVQRYGNGGLPASNEQSAQFKARGQREKVCLTDRTVESSFIWLGLRLGIEQASSWGGQPMTHNLNGVLHE
jgi:hypothetical protein